ncbi:DUF3140 domain-containing protein [Streptomyces sp. NPDC058664]|uniref:DUF3140 domain-containing protein n=1 Tax=unclassified Streptomyces TaxID=2593676 RepID=UPI00366228A6
MTKQDDSRNQNIEEFEEAVNVSAGKLEKWLETDESKSVGQSENDGESIGHASGRRIVELLHAKDS